MLFLTAVGPDHIGTLMTLSALKHPVPAFKVGAAWGLWHTLGMIMIAIILSMLINFCPVHIHEWEHYGHYLIGMSLLACALYFFRYESSYVEEKPDGNEVLRPCRCTGHGYSSCNTHTDGHTHDNDDGHDLTRINDEFESHLHGLEHHEETAEMRGGRLVFLMPGYEDFRGAIIGLYQGVCCPTGFVGLSFLASLQASSIIIFMSVFVFFSVLCTGVIASTWAAFTRAGFGASLAPRRVFRVSCGVTLLIGVLWIVFNYFDILHTIDYTEDAIPHANTRFVQDDILHTMPQ